MQMQGGDLIQEAKDFLGESYDTLLDWYLRHGYVYKDEHMFVMFCEHSKDYFLGKNLEKPVDKWDAWLVGFFAGDINHLAQMMGNKHEWIIFERANRGYKVYNLERLRRKFNGKV